MRPGSTPASMIDETKAAKPGGDQPLSSKRSGWMKSSPLNAWSRSTGPYMWTPHSVQACRRINAEGSTTFSLSPFSATVTLSCDVTATTENTAPAGFQHFVQPQSTSSAEIHVDPAVLAKYVGVYEVSTPRGPAKATMTVEGDQLMVDVPGIGSGRMVPQSATMFAFRGAMIEFVSNEKGVVTHLITHVVEGAFKGPRLDGR